MRYQAIAVATLAILQGCGTLETKAALVSVGDTKEMVLQKMGPAADRQFRATNEAWQYCKSGAGFGWHDHRVIWFENGYVTGVNSYRSTQPGSCQGGIQPIQWQNGPPPPDKIIEIRNR